MIPQGYKQTEIGMIPEDWSIKTLKNTAPLQRGFDLPYSQMEDGKYPVVFSNGIGAYHAKYMVKGPGVVTGRSGTIGKIHYVNNNYWPHNTSLWVTSFCGNYPKYIFYLFNTLNWELYNSGSGVPTLNRNDVHDLKCAIPSFEEQQHIAEALSDVDSMISSLEKLIAKKKAVKQGAMQELLTGKKRLPGFTGEWAHMELGKYGSLMKETINPQLYSTEYFWEYSMPAFDEGRAPIKQKGADMHSNRTVIRGKVLLFNKLNVRQKRIWLIDQCRDSAVCSSEFLPYTSDTINLELLSQILYTDKVTLEFIGMSTGTSNSQKRITPVAFLEYEVYLPVDENEQAAIADMFTCMDNEIEALEQKLAKTRQIKQGMMQQLLTGKIRLK